jgi:carboxyl-terminal processing protease
MKIRSDFATIVAILIFVCLISIQVPAQEKKLDSITESRVQQMLREAHDEVSKNYYDPAIHGMDWDGRYKEYQERLKQIKSLNQGLALVAGMMDGLNDSHTFFQPPPRPTRFDYGFEMMMVGDKAYIMRVRPDTDAATKIHPGDQVIAYNKFLVDRDSLWRLNFVFRQLSPGGEANLAVRDPAGAQREVRITPRSRRLNRVMDLTQESDFWQLAREEENDEHLMRQRYYETGDVMIWKMPEFFLDDGEVDHLFSIAKKHKALVLDLRGNPGGAVTTLERMVGNVFDHDIQIAERKGRKPLKPQLAKAHKDAFSGKIVVLVDSKSASAAELFARVMQLEQRGTVVGDRSSGSVMEAREKAMKQGADLQIFYGFSVTDADLVMKDGKTLEHVGVTPDEIVLPTTSDLAEGADPALARALTLAGLPTSPAQAGKLFPYEWPPTF